MDSCGLSFVTTPYIDNLAGWIKSQSQFMLYLHTSTFKSKFLTSACRQIYNGLGDPGWDYSHMSLAYHKRTEMKLIWDKIIISKTWKNPEKEPEVPLAMMSAPPPLHNTSETKCNVSCTAKVKKDESDTDNDSTVILIALLILDLTLILFLTLHHKITGLCAR